MRIIKQVLYAPILIARIIWSLIGFIFWYFTGGPNEFDIDYQMKKHGV